MSGESFVLLCSGDGCVVIDSHRYMSGTLQGYIKGSNWAEYIASYIFDKHGGLLDMMGCLSTGLHILLAGRSLVPQAVLLCDSGSESSGQQALPQSTVVAEEAELPEGQLLREYGFRFPDAVSVGPSVTKMHPVISKLCELKVARSSSQVCLQSYPAEDNVLQGMNPTMAVRGTISHWLFEITGDSRTHLQVSRCTKYNLHDILPDTWASAVMNVAKSQGFFA